MKKRLYLKLMSFLLVTSLVFGNSQVTALAVQNENSLEQNKISEEAFTEENTEAFETEINTEEYFTEEYSAEETKMHETAVKELTTETEDSEEMTIEQSSEINTEDLTEETAEIETEDWTEETGTETETKTEVLTEETGTETEVLTEETTTEAETETEVLEAETGTEAETETKADEMEVQSQDTVLSTTPESDFVWSGNTIMQYKGNAKEVVIPAKAEKIGSNAFTRNTTIESVVIGENITYISGHAFLDCINLKSVTFKTNKIDNEFKGSGIFAGCSINKVTFAENTTYIPTDLFYGAGFETGFVLEIPETVQIIGNSAFHNATNISTIIFKGNKVTQIGASAFGGTSIEQITLPSSLKSIGGFAFANCAKLKEITIPSEVTTIEGYAFNNCTGLKSVKFETNKITATKATYSIFGKCSINKLTFAENTTNIPNYLFYEAGFEEGFELKIPKDVQRVGDYAFYKAVNLGNISFEGNNVTSIGYAAFNAVAIEQITLPSTLIAIGGYAFSNCTKLKEITIPSEVTSIGGSAFLNCAAIKSVKFETTKLVRDNYEQTIFKGCSINKVTFADNTTYIPNYLFYEAGFEPGFKLEIPETVETIGHFAFFNIANIVSVSFKGGNIKSIGIRAFEGTSIEELRFPPSLTEINANAFINCNKLSKVVITSRMSHIPGPVFQKNSNLIVYVKNDTYAYNWAVKEGYNIGEVYTITYQFNGGTVTEKNPAYYVKGDILNLNTPIKSECTFEGWYTDKYFNTPFICTAETTGNLNLFAKWSGKNAYVYTITYVTNGGTLAKGSPTTYSKDEEVILKDATRKGYKFESWRKYQPNSTAFSTVTKIEKGSTGDIKLNAGWIANRYNIKFVANASNVTGVQEPINNCPYDYAMPLKKCVYSKDGYTFTGWNTKANGKGTSYKDGGTVLNLTDKDNATVTLYGQWKPTEYQIIYHLDNGINNKKNPATYTMLKGVTLLSPKKEGYTFKGWYTDNTFTKKITSIKKGSRENINVYAKWQVNSYNIKFAGNGGKGKSDTLKNCEYNKAYTLPVNTFVRDRYVFAGWNTKSNGKGINYTNGQAISNLTSKNKATVTLYAQWKAIEYKITYHLDNGTNNVKNLQIYTAAKGVTLAAPVKEGYTFKGWYTDNTFTKKITSIKKGSSADVEVYAKWQVNKYNVKFNANKGKGKISTLKNCKYDKTYTLPENTFTRNGYTFTGWNTKKDGTGDSFNNVQEIKNLTAKNKKTVTLYAQWMENKTE